MSAIYLRDISVESVFSMLSHFFKDTYEALLDVLHEEPNYKRLFRIGERQFFDAPSESSIEEETQKSRLSFAKTSLLAVQVDNDIDRIIQEKLEGEFFCSFKDAVLKTVLNLSSNQVCSSVEVPSSRFKVKQRKIEDKAVLATIKDLSNYCARNIIDIKKQVNKMPDGPNAVENINEAHPSVTTNSKLDIDIDDVLSNISIGSVSSVHTSDLSSFEDEISLTSDEEFGLKGKKVSLKEVQEKLEKSVSEKLGSTKDDQQVKHIHNDDMETDLNGNNELSSNSPKNQRKRKPNLKYTIDDMVTPFKKKSVENISSPAIPVNTTEKRKRGRPRKHPILS